MYLHLAAAKWLKEIYFFQSFSDFNFLTDWLLNVTGLITNMQKSGPIDVQPIDVITIESVNLVIETVFLLVSFVRAVSV